MYVSNCISSCVLTLVVFKVLLLSSRFCCSLFLCVYQIRSYLWACCGLKLPGTVLMIYCHAMSTILPHWLMQLIFLMQMQNFPFICVIHQACFALVPFSQGKFGCQVWYHFVNDHSQLEEFRVQWPLLTILGIFSFILVSIFSTISWEKILITLETCLHCTSS